MAKNTHKTAATAPKAGKASTNGRFAKGGAAKRVVAKDAPMSEADRLTLRAWARTYKNRDKRLD